MDRSKYFPRLRRSTINAATFLEQLEEQRMQDIPYYRCSIPNADPLKVATEKRGGARPRPHVEEQKRIIAEAMGDETLALGVIAERVKMGKWTVCKRLQNGPFENVRKGIWKRVE